MTTDGPTEATTPTERLVETCYTIDWDDVPERERAHAVSLFTDFVGVVLGSADSVESSRIVRDYARSYGGGPASVVGVPEGGPPAVAAFANGTVAHGIELDDTHSGSSSHPGAVVFPTALAVAETEGATGRALMSAVVAGYELTTRIGRAADPAALYDRGFHPTAVCGVFGAALTAARLQGLDLEETVNAVGIAGSFAGGNLEYLADGTLSKRVQPGIAARAGVTAAALAARGYTGPRTILEGENGFLDGYSDRASLDPLFDEFDDGYAFEVARTGVKPHACCRYNQTPIDAVLSLRDEHGLGPVDVDTVTVGVVDAAFGLVAEPWEAKLAPRTPTDAQFSLPYSVAVALVEGQAFFEQYREPYLTDDRVLSLAERVSVEHAPELEAAFPDQWGARVTVTKTDGTELTARLETCKGDPSNMLTAAELDTKFRTLAGRRLDDEALDRLAVATRDIAAAESVTAVTDAFS
jgi:2-methylcitrate dehydratase PrpD